MNMKELFDLIKARKRMCESHPTCLNCPLRFAVCRFDSDLEDIADLDRLIRTVKEWAAEHPALEEVGDNIYFDPKHRIVPDEIVRVYTLEVTYIKDGHELGEEEMKFWRELVMPQWLNRVFPAADDVKCVKVQQFITKAHEEDI